MKRFLNSIVFIAATSMALLSCQKEQNLTAPAVKDIAQTVKLTVHAKAENLSGDTKTYIEGKQVLWGTGEYMTAALVSGEDLATYNSNSSSADAWSGESQAMFEFDVELSAGPVTYGGIYPTSAVVPDNNKNATAFKVNLSAMQSATAASYDPSAYIMIAKPETFTEATSEWIASFRRTTALNKITLTGLEDNITSVKITVPEGKYLAGRRYMDLTTGDKGEVYNGGGRTNALTINYSTPIASDVEDKDIWFTSWGVEIPKDAKMTIVAYSDNFSYTREITAREGGIKFNEGFLNTLSINMASAVKESLTDCSGNYLIVSTTHLLTDYNTSNYYNYVEAAGEELSDFWEIDGIENYVWTVSKLDDGSYSFYNAGTGKYLALTGDSNNAHEAENADENTARFTITEDNSALMIYSKAYPERKLRYNTSSPRFAFYSSNTGAIATLLEYTTDPRTPFDVVSGLTWDASGKTLSWTVVEGATNGYEYTTDNGTTVTPVDANSIDCSSWNNGDYSVKVRVIGTEEKKTSQWSDACEFTISGGVAAKYYRKVTEGLGDWTGTYLIVSGSSAANGTITSGWLGYIPVNADADNKILSATNTDAVAVTIEETADDGIYTIQFANEKYLGTTDSNSGIKVADSAGGDFKWTFSFGDGLVKIESTIKDDRHLRLNGTSGFRTYTNTTGTQATLYKLDEVAVSSITVSGTPTKTSYSAGEAFDTAGLTVTATYADGSTKDVTNKVKWTVTPATLSTGTTSVTVVAEYNNVESSEFVVEGLSVKELSSISVKTAPTKTTYIEGEKFDPAGLVINKNYSDESVEEVAYSGNESDFTFNPTTSTALTTSVTSVTITYSGKSVSQAITVNEKPALETMDAIFAAATAAGSTAKDAKVKFDNWVISGVKNNNAYLTDNNGKGLIIYTSGHGFEVGDILSGTVNCKVQLYNGSAELTSLTSTTTGLTVTKGGTITPATISIADLSGVNTGAVITFESLTYNGSAFSDGVNTITPYDTFITLPAFISGRNYKVTGVYIQYNSTKEIAPRTDIDIVEKEAPKYTVTVDGGITNGTVTVDCLEATEGQTVTITATPSTGFKVKSVSARKTASGVALTVTNNKFVMPAEAVTVSAEFEEAGGEQSEYTYTFTSKSWGASLSVDGGTPTTNNWTSGKDGGQLTANQGIQVSKTYTGANGTSDVSYTNVSKIVVKYCTNTSDGVGTIKVQVGSGTEKSFSVTKPAKGTGTTLKDAEFTFSPNETGKVKITAECTTNSVYIYGVTITAN